jgi:hypothetical protein
MTKLITSYDKGLKLPVRNSSVLRDGPPIQMRTISYNEAAPWSRSNHLMGTRLLLSSDDSANNFSRTPLETLGLR